MGSDFEEGEWAILRRMAERAQRPLTALVLQMTGAPERWRQTLDWIHEANTDGLEFTGQVPDDPRLIHGNQNFRR